MTTPPPRRRFDPLRDNVPLPDMDPDNGDYPVESPSGVHRIKQLANVAISTKLQWGAIATVVAALVGFGPGVWKTLTELNMAYAQTRVVAEDTKRELDAHLIKDAADKQDQKKDMKALYDAVTKHKRSKRLEKIDAGTDEDD